VGVKERPALILETLAAIGETSSQMLEHNSVKITELGAARQTARHPTVPGGSACRRPVSDVYAICKRSVSARR